MSKNDEQVKSVFINNLSSTLAVKSEYESKNYDYEWIDMIETTLPYLENILKNPRRFIVDEEEVVKVELSRKTTVESVIHLTQHTNFIQDYDDDSGEVSPSKVLNINKEESLDTYENRFIFTLINNLLLFIESRTASTGNNSFFDKKNISYEGFSNVGNENVKISLHLTSNDANNVNKNKVDESGVFDRIEAIRSKVSGFMASDLMHNLSMIHAAPVKSPIKKTNVILKNPNFQRAEALWNYLNSYEPKDKIENINKDYYDVGSLKEEYDQLFLKSFIANSSINKKSKMIVSEDQMISDIFDKVIENILDTDSNITDDEIQDIFNKRVKAVRNRISELSFEIHSIFSNSFDFEKNKIEEVKNLLGC